MRVRETFDSTILRDFYQGRETPIDREQDELNSRRRKFKNILENDTDFYLLHRCTNISAGWLSMLAASVVEDFANAPKTSEPLDEQVAALAFFSRLANDLWAIIELIETGFDLQARALTRSYLEHVDALICCIQDKELTKEFVRAVEPEDSNAFWHKYISKNKLKVRVSIFISEKIGVQNSKLVDILREDAELSGSMLLHPTVTAGLSTAFGNEDGDYESYPIFPTPLAASVGILRTILIHLFWLWFAMESLPKIAAGQWRSLFLTDALQNNRELDRFANIYSKMFGFLLDNQLLMIVSDSNEVPIAGS
ncbi:hypothetical protein EOA13_22010 [Mesorhizobium sp. M7A.F.Ca.US.011.01.1.1]|uniref:hypothetical protein n=1 Tax=Mesorhizobium sp. M7A.F.Ca.US.011.01.1.1 TaxID=2496741 RepID=UPI000FC9D2E1|nr:hypothetical protein [Mesorhizobium sp. M7A.F.Ca.US.011.01.1.1]RUX27004.1 hypothetical protein EOA13_22010 [Mesorhizobium sp. M7A.F.Ca.US.011.01.1.1]